MLFLVLSYGSSSTLPKYFYPIHPLKSAHWCSRKRLIDFSETAVNLCFEKIAVPEISAYFQGGMQSVVLFKFTRRSFWDCYKKSCLEQLLCKETVRACFCEKKLCSRRNLKNFPEF